MSAALPPPGTDELAHSQRLEQLINAQIIARGPLPFSHFMELCLYAPGLGYYSAGKTKFGRDGDFITAPELGPLFARCVAASAVDMLRALGPEADFVELGGGSGAFARDALLAFYEAGVLPRRYAILEPSADLRERQRERLHAELPEQLASRVDWLDRPPEQSWRGVLFANEVIDALPTTRFVIREGEVFEEHVSLVDGVHVIEDRPADAMVRAAVRHVEKDLGEPMADGYRSEILPQLPYWMQAVLGSLTAGAALFVDYGYERGDYYMPQRRDGTLLCHYRHRAHANPLVLHGLQDITASVDFTALAEAGNSAGFGIAGYASQAGFLLAGGLPQQFDAAYIRADEADRYQLAQQVKMLTLPGQMGDRFQMLLLARDIDPEALPAALVDDPQRTRL